MTEDKRADLLRKVRGLLDTADSFEATGNAAAAQTYRDKAEQLVASYAIATFELEMATDPRAKHYRPETREYRYGDYPPEIRSPLISLFSSLANHCGVRLGEYRWDKPILVGFPGDIDYLDLLYTNVRLHMSASVRPQASREVGYEASLALLKESGLKWREIYLKLLPLFPERFVDTVANVNRNKDAAVEWEYAQNKAKEDNIPLDETWWVSRHTVKVGDSYFVKEVPRPIGVRFTKEYTTFCEETGRQRVYADPQVYLRSFIEGYVDEIRSRLRKMKEARDEATSGKELVIVSMKGDLDEFFYELYPERRPHPEDCDCDLHHYCKDPKCQRPNCVAARKPVRYRAYTAPATSTAGRQRGRAAGATADLSGGRNNLGNRKGEING